MNTRGLMELVALNIGYEIGSSSPVYIRNFGHYGVSYDFMTTSFASFGGTYFRTSRRKVIFEA